MPKERVQRGEVFVWEPDATGKDPVAPGMVPSGGRPYHPGQQLPEGAILREEPSLDVTWRREDAGGWVQIGFDAPRDWWERFIASYEGSPEAHHFAAWTAVLDRREINHMIRTLRRARDAAYGNDE